LPLSEKPKSYTVAGAGVFGVWIAYTLRRAGHAVALVDPFGPAHSRASSGGESRIIRASYGADELYTRMAVHSLALWQEFFASVGRPELFQRTGVLWLTEHDDAHANASRIVLRQAQVEFEDLSPAEVRGRYPQMNIPPEVGAILERNGGALMARQAVQAVVAEFIRIGGTYTQAAVPPAVDDDSALIYACGGWLGKLFPDLLGPRLFLTRQEILFFGLPPGDLRFQPPQLPVWLDFSAQRGMYGFPDLESRGFKLACDRHGPSIDPDNADRVVSQATVEQMRVYLAERFPALAHAPVVDSRVCQYENTSNGDFIIDRHPTVENVWLAGGGSGHGFKHGPAVGEYVAQLVTSEKPRIEPRFLLAGKTTMQDRAVF
jgi:glycine/D-amino acid oxidase-like deaminating enzyme